jgi:hypothetical protein
MNAMAFVSYGNVRVRVRMLSSAVITPVIVLGLMLNVGCGGSNSTPPPPPPPPSYTYAGSGALFVGDFNQDSKPDLLTSDGTMNIGQGDGTFITGTRVKIPTGLSVVTVADFNGDRKLDLLVANLCTTSSCSSTTASLLLGNGDGTFQTGAVVALSAADLQVVGAADLNGDGKADVVGVFGDGTVQVFLNDGGGSLASGVAYLSGASLSYELALGDFNEDKITDIAVSTNGGDPNTQFGGQQNVFLGNGDGTFQSAKSSLGPNAPYSAVTADLNQDGNLDLAVGDCNLIYGCTVYIFLGVGDGTWQSPIELFPATSPDAELSQGPIAVSDLNGDGKWDLIVQTSGTVPQVGGHIFLGNGDGTFPKTASYSMDNSTLQASVWIAIADFNGDAKPDIAFNNHILLGIGDGTFQVKPK